jgi:hypothetical protein
MLYNPLGALPFLVSEVANHLDNLFFNIGHNLLVSFVRRAFYIEYRASYILV